MSSMIKNGSLDFGELKSGGSLGFGSGSPGLSESDKQRQSSPRSPVGRTDKRPKDFDNNIAVSKKSPLIEEKQKNET